MKNLFISTLVKFISVDTIASLIAKCIAKLLKYASLKGGSKWDTAKCVISKMKIWIDLFLEVYEDDTLTLEEEQKIADAIKNQTNIEKISDVLK